MTNLWDVPEDDDPNASAAEARLRQSYGINPEQAAQIDALARRAKVPLAAAQTQTDLLKAQTAAADNKRALMNAPATRAFIAADQGNADLTHDHVAQVSNLEPRWTVAGAAAKTMKGVGGTIGGAFLQASSSIWGLIEASAEAPRMLPEPDFAKEVRAQIAADARKQRQYGQQVAQDITPKTGTWWGDALVQGTQSTVQSGIGLAASVAMRNPTPALAGMAAFTAGGEYGKARDEGVSPGRAATYAAGQGAFEALTEMIPTGVLLKALETGQGPLKGFAKTLLAELPGEQVATLLQDMNQWVTLNPDKSVGEFLRERPQAAAETALATLSATGGSVATGYAAQAVMNRVVERDAAAEQAGVASKAFDALVKDTTALPLRERSPERFKALMDTMGEGVDVHVNADVLTKYLQSLDPEAAATIVEATGIGDQIAAATPEADIVIPASDYLTFVAPEGHSFLQKDIKLGPAALSLNEAEAHKEERDQLLADAAAQALDLGTEQAQADDPVERVRQHFYDQAKAIGVPDDQARANAAVQAAYYAQRAARNTTYQNAWDAYAEANISMAGRGITTAGPGGVGGGGATFDLQQGDSEPVMLHGTQVQFEGLPTKGMFIQNPEFARNFAGKTGRVIPFYFRPKNPANREQADALDRDPERLRAAGFDGAIWDNAAFVRTGIIVDPAAVVEIDPKTFEQGPRGQVSFSEQGALIELFKSRNASTLIHEGAGHIWLENLARDAADANATPEVRADLELVKAWWRENVAQAVKESGLPEERLRAAIDAFGAGGTDVEAIRPFHEMFARAAERYFMEGKAPTPALRGPFAKFRQWLVGIYKDFTALRVPMTDDMRGVFDRLIAGQETMAEAIVEQRLQPFFPDAATAGMTDAEYAAYLKTIQTADEAAEDRLLGKLMSDIRRKYTEAWKTERAALVEEFQAQVNDTPEMRALSLLESGEARLSRDAVQDILGDRQEGALYRRQRPYVFDDGVHPDVVAEQAGMSSGQALVEALLAMKEEHDALRDLGDKRTVRVARAEALADAEMLARHGDILNDGTIGEEAVAALHDARRSEAMAAEVRALVRKAGATTLIWSEQEMRAWAERRIGALPLDKIRPHVYSAAEAKAGRDALKALVKDDFQAALDAKFRQLLNAHLYRVARDARDGIEKGKSLFDQIAHARNGTISKSRNMDMVGAARQIIAAYGYEAAANDADYMAKVAAYDPELYADLRDTVTAALAGARDIDTLKLDEFNSLHEAVAQLWRMSRTSRQMEIEFQTLEVEDIANDLAEQLGSVAPRQNTHAPTNIEHAFRILSGFRAALRRVEAWVEGIDGGRKGAWRTYVWQPVSEAATQFRVAKADYMTRFMELLEPIQGSLKRGKIEAPELAYTFGFANSGVGKGELLHALLHTGNESNKRKLLLGRGWAVERADGTLDTTAWDQFLDRMHAEGVITEADWQFAQSVWDLLEDMKPAAQKAHRAVFGRYFEEVTANPVVTPFGTFRGGYVPAITDTFLVQEQALNAQADAITDANDASMFPSPNRGFTKARVEYNKPLLLDLGLLPGHIDKVLKFSYMTAPVRDVLRLLKEKGLSAKLEAFDAAVVPDLLLPWLNRAAKQIVETPTRGNAGRGFDNFFRAMRHRTGMGIMIANVSNTLQQITGWAPAALKVRKRSLTRALWQVTRDPKGMAAAIRTMSPYMATRTTQTVQEASGRIERLLMDPTKFQKVSDFSQRHAYVMQSITQNLVDMVTWSAAFEESLERGEDLPEAVRSADAVIRQTQGSLAPEDVSRFEVGPPVLRMFTQFYSYFNVQGNLWATEFKNSKTLTRSAYVYIMGIAAPAILADAIRRAFGEGWDDDDDDGYLDTFLDVFFGSQFRYVTGAIPIAGQVIANMANQFNDKPFDDKLVPAPAISTIEQVARLPEDVWLATTEGKRQKAAVRETATLLTLLTGVPLFNVAARPLGYLADINEGKVEPTGPVDFARGLATGAASNESRVQ